MRVVAPCSADRTLAHQVLRVHYAGASVAWRYTLDMSSLNASSLPTTRIAAMARSARNGFFTRPRPKRYFKFGVPKPQIGKALCAIEYLPTIQVGRLVEVAGMGYRPIFTSIAPFEFESVLF